MDTRVTGAEDVVWDLSDLYDGPADPRFKEEVASALDGAARFSERYHGKVSELDAAALAAAVSELERLSEGMSRAGSFAALHWVTDTADPARGALLQELQEKRTAFGTEVLFFSLEWLAIDEERAKLLLEDPALAVYRHFLAAARRYRPHVLTEPEEKVVAEKSVTGSSAWVRLFTELTSALRVTADGREMTFQEGFALLQQPDREVRRSAAEALTETLEPGLRTRLFIFNTLLQEKATEDRLRRYPNWIASRNLSNEASDGAVEALVQAVVGRYDIPQRYYRLKARLLGLDRLADYDRVAPLPAADTFVDWDQARDLVVEAYESFSSVAGKIIRDFFDRRWIDAAVRPNKEGGAFCETTIPGVHPYVLLNYTGERRSVLTLAHELGHALHGALAGANGLFNADTPLTLAETASVFGEALTFKRLMKGETDPKRRLSLITGRIEDSIATIFRQIAMNRFEDAVHNARRTRGELSPGDIAEAWFSTQASMLGDAVELGEGYRNSWWSYIPHFIHSPGYVYAYAFGYLFSMAIFDKYQNEGESMVEPYLGLLRAGGSESPESLATSVGLDLTDPGFWTRGLEPVSALVDEAESLASELGALKSA